MDAANGYSVMSVHSSIYRKPLPSGLHITVVKQQDCFPWGTGRAAIVLSWSIGYKSLCIKPGNNSTQYSLLSLC